MSPTIVALTINAGEDEPLATGRVNPPFSPARGSTAAGACCPTAPGPGQLSSGGPSPLVCSKPATVPAMKPSKPVQTITRATTCSTTAAAAATPGQGPP